MLCDGFPGAPRRAGAARLRAPKAPRPGPAGLPAGAGGGNSGGKEPLISASGDWIRRGSDLLAPRCPFPSLQLPGKKDLFIEADLMSPLDRIANVSILKVRRGAGRQGSCTFPADAKPPRTQAETNRPLFLPVAGRPLSFQHEQRKAPQIAGSGKGPALLESLEAQGQSR